MCIYSPMPHTLSYCALLGKCALTRSNTVIASQYLSAVDCWECPIEVIIISTVNPLYNSTHYNSKILYNVIFKAENHVNYFYYFVPVFGQNR